MLNKIILLILLFPLASTADPGYTEAVNKIGEILYNNSREKRDLEAGFAEYKRKVPDYIVMPMEIIIPTAIKLIEKKVELRYMKEF